MNMNKKIYYKVEMEYILGVLHILILFHQIGSVKRMFIIITITNIRIAITF